MALARMGHLVWAGPKGPPIELRARPRLHSPALKSPGGRSFRRRPVLPVVPARPVV